MVHGRLLCRLLLLSHFLSNAASFLISGLWPDGLSRNLVRTTSHTLHEAHAQVFGVKLEPALSQKEPFASKVRSSSCTASAHKAPLSFAEVDNLLDDAYALYEGDSMDAKDQEVVNAVSGQLGFVYGEITARGMRRLAWRVNLTPSDIFYDLGSGVGRAVLQAFLEFDVQRSVGIELASTRHEQAELAWRRLQLAGIEDGKRSVQLIEGDILQEDCSDATVVFVSSLCFSEELMAALALKLPQCLNLRAILSLQRFPAGIQGFTVREEWEGLEMSWMVGKERDQVRVFVYSR